LTTMDTDLVQTVAHHVETVMGSEGFRQVSAVVANCKMFALELEALQDEGTAAVDTEGLVIAAYFHDISTLAHGLQNHEVQSAEMAAEFLLSQNVPEERIQKVEQAILAHMTPLTPAQRATAPIEGQILYDADKVGHLSGLAVVTSLIEFGGRYANRAVTSDVLANILRHIEERFIELYQSLNTEPARELAREKFNQSVAFLDGVIEHVSDATPV
jgi:HD superfamily phosphodiesterase